jgi:hypothetical protein
MPIQDLPAFFDMIYTIEGGRLSPDGYLYNDQTFQTLNNLVGMFNNSSSTLFSDVASLQAVGINAPALLGINPPSFTTTQITAILALAPPDPVVPVGTMWYNSTIKKLQFKSDTGVVETITSV